MKTTKCYQSHKNCNGNTCNQEKVTHTPTPWRIDGDDTTGDFELRVDGEKIAEGLSEANAAFIVRAVNSFDAMLDFIKSEYAKGRVGKKRAEEIIAQANGK